ncbi:MAG: PAS domain S-box protein [Actinomycetota bacterium]|nr:PAS domain S-box protein [Actinomycetota bacterium]
MDAVRPEDTTVGRDIMAPEYTGAQAPLDPLDQLLRQVIDGFFLLTDGNGAVSKWSEPAELLFGMSGPRVLGRPMFDALLDPGLTPEGRAWRGFLERGDAPNTAGRVELSGYNPAVGVSFPLEIAFIPVKLDEGFDFSLFLEDLSFELPLNLMLKRIRQQHPVVVRAFTAAASDEPHPWEQWRTAGTMVVLRPLAETPWVQAALDERARAREEADAQLEERLTETDPGIHGESIYELEDAAAVVARMLDAFQRIEELERTTAVLPMELEAARGEADATRGRAEAAEREAREARAEVQEALARLAPDAAVHQRQELMTRVERLENDRGELARRLNSLIAEVPAQQQLTERMEAAERRQAEGVRQLQEAVDARIGHTDEQISGLQERIGLLHGDQANSAQAGFSAVEEQLEALRRWQEQDATRFADVTEQLLALQHDDRHQRAIMELARRMAVERGERERVVSAEREQREQHTQTMSERVDAMAAALEQLRTEDAVGPRLQQLAEHIDQISRRDSSALEDLRSRQDQTLHELREQLDHTSRLLDEQGTGTVQALREASEQAGARAHELSNRLESLENAGNEERARIEAAIRAADEMKERIRFFELSREEARAAAQQDLERGLHVLRSEVEARLAAAGTTPGETDDRVAPAALEALRARIDDLADTAVQAGARAEDARQAAQHAGRHALELFDGSRQEHEALRARLDALRTETGSLPGQLHSLEVRVTETSTQVETLQGDAAQAAEHRRLADDRAQQGVEQLRQVHEGVEALTGRVQAAEEQNATTAQRAGQALEHSEAALEQASQIRRVTEDAGRTAAEAAAGVGELRDAVGGLSGRVDGLDQRATEHTHSSQEQLGQLRAGAEELRTRADELGALGNEAREQATTARALAEHARSSAAQAHGTAEEARQTAAAAQQAGTQAVAEARRAEHLLGEQIKRLDERVSALGNGAEQLQKGIAGALERVEGVQADVARVGGNFEGALVETRTDIANLRDEASTLRSDAAGLRDLLAETAAVAGASAGSATQEHERLTALTSEVASMRAVMEEFRKGFEEARHAAVSARREAEQARRALETGKEAQVAEGNKLNEAVAQLFGAAAAAGAGARRPAEPNVRPLSPARSAKAAPSVPMREPRAGFDDAASPRAVIDLSGRFKELNAGFVKLVGYPEHEFSNARWPSVHDRATLKEQEEQLRRLACGELESVQVQSSYLHGQGLMVLVSGELSLVRDGSGQPQHLLLTARDR